MKKTVHLSSAALLISTLSSVSHAAGPAFSRLFAEANGADTAYFSAAGMTRLKASELSAQAILGQSFAEFEVDESLTTTDGGNPRDADPVIVPALYYVRPLGEDWRLGLTMNVPSGFGAGNGPNWAGRYYSDQFSLVFINASATLAYPVTDWLSLGGGLSVIASTADSTVQVNNPGLDEPDAKLETEAEGVGVGFIASALLEFSPNTRLAFNWHSESEPDEDVEVDLKRSTLPPALVDAINQQGDNIDASIRLPQRVELGLFHEFSNGWSATLDAIWVEFSRFGLTELNVDGEDLAEGDMNFQDFWVVTAGLGFPITPRLEGRIGAMYVEQPVNDDDRTFSFALDEMYGAGVGVTYTRPNNHSFDLNLTVMNTGEAPVDTGTLSALGPRGRVAGEDDSPYAVALEFTYHWH
jgi:long-chain fatty acid transport protein